MKEMKNTTKGTIFVLVSALMFGSYGVWSRLIRDSLGVFYQSWTRSLLIVLILLPFIIYRKEFVPIRRKDRKWMAIFLVFTSLTQAPIFYAYNHMDIGTASLLFFVSTLITMYAVGFIFLGEKSTKIKYVSFFIACVGLFFTFSFSVALFPILAASMAVLNGIASGGEISSSKKLSNAYSPLYITWLSWAIIAFSNCIVSIVIGETQYIPSFNLVWLYFVGYTIASIFGFWLVITGLKYLEASIAGLIGLLEIVFSILFGIILFGESLTLKVVIGALLIIIAASLPYITSPAKVRHD